MIDDFDRWNTIKKAINKKSDITNRFPREREVWMSSMGKNIGFEQNGSDKDFSRPVLIIKKFNNKIFWCLPLTTKQKNFDFYFNFKDLKGNNVSVILAQIRLLSVKRMERKMYELEDVIFFKIRGKLKSFL